MSEVTLTAEQIKKRREAEAQERAIMKEMLPLFLYGSIPIIITLTIAFVFGPAMTLY